METKEINSEKKKTASIVFIFITMLIDCIGFGIIIPIVPKLIENLIHGDISTAAKYGGFLTVSYALMQFIFSPILGGLSDKFGRRPILLFSMFGLGIDYIFMAFAPTITWLFIGRIISGITGASFTTAAAYIADVSSPEKRAQNFGLIGVAFGVGFIIGPVIGGLFAKYGTEVPFLIAAGLTLINWLYGYFFIPESLSKANRRDFSIKRANPIGSLMQAFKNPAVITLLVSLSLLYLAGHATQTTWTYYTMEKFHWNEREVGFSLGFVGLIVAIVQGGLIRMIIPKLGARKSTIVGLILYMIGFVLFAFSSQPWMMYAFMIPYGLGGITGPAIQGIISNLIPDNEQGELQGTNTSLQSLAAIVGPFMMTTVFYHFTKEVDAAHYFPGAPFLLAAVLTFFSILLCVRSIKKYH